MNQKFFIDYENVGVHGVKKMSCACEDEIFLFYTENASKISMDALSGIKASIRFIPVPSGKQSLDMHLATWLGYEVSQKDENCAFIIVSNDLDYDPIIQFWKSRGIQISRLPVETSREDSEAVVPKTSESSSQGNIDSVKMPSPVSAGGSSTGCPSQRSELNCRVMRMCAEAKMEQKTVGSVASVVVKYYFGPNRKELIYKALVKNHGIKAGTKYYRIIKKAL